MKHQLIYWLLFGLLILVAACHSSSSSSNSSMQPATARLYLLQSCNELEQSLREAALKEMNTRLDQSLEQALKYRSACNESGGYHVDAGISASSFSNSSSSSPADPSSSSSGDNQANSEGEPSQVSGTNNQVTGVDEADLVKNDNKYIYLVSGNAFRIVEAWPPTQVKELTKIEIEGKPHRLFVQGDRALIYSSLTSVPYSSESDDSKYSSSYSSRECTYGYDCDFIGDGLPTKITIFDISDRHSPRLVRELQLSGSYLTSRRVDNAIYTVVTSPGAEFPGVDYYSSNYYSCYSSLSDSSIKAAFAKLRAENTRIINETPLKNLVPTITDTLHQNGTPVTSDNILGQCSGFYRASVLQGNGFITLLSLDLTREDPVSTSTIISGPGAAFASATALYLAVPRQQSNDEWYWWSSFEQEQEVSVIHKFALQNEPVASTYAASGVIKGRVLNQFSIDEYENHLRLATTTGHLPSENVHSTLSVLKQEGVDLVTTGQLDNIAPQEDIRSARFAGDRGYIVTFKKTDPLFVLDLHDPQQPRIWSELKIPGFSTYMHMMDAEHILTLGYDTSDQENFAWFTGVRLQIFNVSSPDQPTLQHKEIIGTRGSSSEALTNHLAFNYFAPKNLLSLPMTVCEGGDEYGGYGTQMTFSGLMVYDVTTQDGFKLHGKVFHVSSDNSDPYNYDYGYGECSNWWSQASSKVKRSIIMDDVIFSISDELLKANRLDNLAVDLASLSIDK